MPQEKDLKRLVRERMAATGERYTAALAAITGTPPSLAEARALVRMLADVEQANTSFERLKNMSGSIVRDVAVEGMSSPEWRVRKRCAQLLDDLTLTDASIAALRAALKDRHPDVRAAALHSLVCESCKPDGCTFDARALAMAMLNDPSASVRRKVVGEFWRWDDVEHSMDALAELAEGDPSPRVREAASRMAAHYARVRAGNEARMSMPSELQTKMAKHVGKWVAVADGVIVAAERFEGQLRRHLKGKGYRSAVKCYVPKANASLPVGE